MTSGYAEWAEDYDADVVDEGGYSGFKTVCDRLFAQNVPADSRVLDAGCGTGLSGEVLAKAGFTNVHGFDFSQDMLDQAEKKGVYQEYIQGDLTEPLALPDNEFDAIVCAGTFTTGHVGPEALDEMVRITKPGGYICFTVRDDAWEQDDFGEVMERMTKEGAWTVLESFETEYLKQDKSTCQVCVCQVS